MLVQQRTFSPQEERIERGLEQTLIPLEGRKVSDRINRMLKDFRKMPPRIDVQRARLYTDSFRETEGLPIVLRAAKAMENIMANIEIAIGNDEIIIGRSGPLGRHGLLYPEFRAGWFEKGIKDLASRKEGMFTATDEDIRIVNEEIVPYWKGRTVHDAYVKALPEETRNLLYKKDINKPNEVIHDLSGQKSTMNWISDMSKAVTRGFNDIRRQAEERLKSLDPLDPQNGFEKMPFLNAVIIVCNAVTGFAKRYADLARRMAVEEKNQKRKQELLETAEICEWVPSNPARTFREAIQSLWFTRLAICFEQEAGGEGLGRIDQYLYPYYINDIEAGKISPEEALELLEHLWLNMAQYVRLSQTGIISFIQGYAHFEQVTVGGQTRDGRDATNELSFLLLESRRQFPLEHPDLMVRIHARTPQHFLIKVCECIKEGTGFPKLMNDEEIVPLLVAKGVTMEEARDYCGSGCTEVRLPNRDTYASLGIQLNLPAALELVLNKGGMRLSGERLGVSTRDPRTFISFEAVMDAFKAELQYLLTHCFIKQTISDTVRPERMASPLHSCLHDLCMEQCVDIHSGQIKGGLVLGNLHMVGFGTVIDSLAAIKKLVFDDRAVTMEELLGGLDSNYEGKEVLRQMCLNAPKFGNNDLYVDSIGHELEGWLVSFVRKYRNLRGGKQELSYVPITAHVPMGAVVGATPDGRRAKEPLSEGISPVQGADTRGPTVSLLSIANTRNARYKERQARLLNMKLSPQVVTGDEGTRNLAALIRTWCDLKLWHIQFNIINSETLKEARKNPEKYRNLLVRVAGYSAYFVELSPALQEEIIKRTEHRIMA